LAERLRHPAQLAGGVQSAPQAGKEPQKTPSRSRLRARDQSWRQIVIGRNLGAPPIPARSTNFAGVSRTALALLDQPARQQGREQSSLAQSNQLSFANEAFRRQMAALQGISGLYGVDTSLLGRTLGIPAELLNVRANAGRSQPGFFSSFGSALGHTLGGLPGLFFSGGRACRAFPLGSCLWRAQSV